MSEMTSVSVTNLVCASCGDALDLLHAANIEEDDALCEGCAEDRLDAHRSQDSDEEERGGFYDDDDCSDFADPGGRSALRAASPSNPRNQPCPNCYAEDVLTPKDVALGYVCDTCADRAEGLLPDF